MYKRKCKKMNSNIKDTKSKDVYLVKSIIDITDSYVKIMDELKNDIQNDIPDKVYQILIIDYLYSKLKGDRYTEYEYEDFSNSNCAITAMTEFLKTIKDYENISAHTQQVLKENLSELIDTINNSFSEDQSGKVKLDIAEDKQSGKINLIVRIYPNKKEVKRVL